MIGFLEEGADFLSRESISFAVWGLSRVVEQLMFSEIDIFNFVV